MAFRDRPKNRARWDDEEESTETSWPDARYSDQDDFEFANPEQLPDWSRRRPLPGDPDESPLPTRERPSRRREPRQPAEQPTFPSLRDSLSGSRRARSRIPAPVEESEYDRPQRSVGRDFPQPPADQRRSRSRTTQWDVAEEPETFDRYPVEDHRYPSRPDAYRQRRNARTAQPRPRPTFQMPAAVTTFASTQDRSFLIQAGVSLLSLLLMLVTVSARVGTLPDWIVTHLDASGRPDQWGTSSTIWRLPLMVFMVSVASFVSAFFLAKRDAFAAKFLISATLLVQSLAWIALVRILW